MSDRKTLIENAIAEIDAQATDRQREYGAHYLHALEGDLKSKFKLMEGISTSDIPTVLTPAINVQFLAQYAAQRTVWQDIVDETIDAPSIGDSVEFGGFDFDTSSLLGDHDGDTYVGAGLPGVGEYDEYPAVKFTVEQLEAELRKNGVRLRVSWEALRKTGNFDLIGRSTQAFARYAAEQEDVVLAKQFISVAGAINPRIAAVTGNPALDLEGLAAAKAQLAAATVNGRPIAPSGYKLVTGAALSTQAEDILSIRSVRRTDGSDEYDIAPRNGDVTPVNFWALDSVGNYTTAGTTDDIWFLIATGGARPTFAEIFLEGERQPLISIKDSGHFALSGGAVPVRQGNFTHDDVETRGRHVVGAALVNESGVVASNPTP